MITLAVIGISVWVCVALTLADIKSILYRYEKSQPFPNGLPESEIVFSLYDPFFAHGLTKKTIGFVDAEGDNRKAVFFNIAGGSATLWPRNYSTYVNGPRWNSSGDELVFTIRDVRPNVRVINSEGLMYGKDCADIDLAGYHLEFDNEDYLIAWISDLNSGYEHFAPSEISEDEQLVVKYDVKSCQIVEILIVPISSEYWLFDLNLSDEYLSVMLLDTKKSRFNNSERPYKTFLMNLENGDTKEFLGVHPSLSDDGSLLAFFDYSGNLVVENLDDGTQKDIETPISQGDDFEFICRPGWSSDNQWLVFNDTEGNIYKLNIMTEELKFLTKGYCPDWR